MKMTNKSKILVILSIVLAVCVIATSALYVFSAKGGDTGPYALFIIILVLAALSVWLVLFARRARGAEKLLDANYYRAFERIKDYLAVCPLSPMECREVKRDVLSLFLEAQRAGRSVAEVTGGDEGRFVRSIRQSFGYRNSIVYNLLSSMQYALVYIFFIQTYEWFKAGAGSGYFAARAGIGAGILLVIAAFLAIPLMRTLIKKEKMVWAVVAPVIIVALYIAFDELASRYWLSAPLINTIVNGEISYVPSWWFAALWAVLFATAGLLKLWQRRASVKSL